MGLQDRQFRGPISAILPAYSRKKFLMFNDEELEEHFLQMEKELYELEVTSKSPDKFRPNLWEDESQTLRYD